jgi:ADP-ribose pyrophosphatase YjhB (NUDIX family)
MKLTSTLLNKKFPKVAVSMVPFLKVKKETYDVLLIKRKNEPDKGLWSIPGGSVEYGECTTGFKIIN